MLPVSRLVRVGINLSPLAAADRSFGVLLIGGDSNVISASERFRTYSTIDDVQADFGTQAPEAIAASLYFGQTPQPSTLMIGRWLATASAGLLTGGILNSSQQAIGNFTAVTAGGMIVPIDGTNVTLAALDFSGAANLNAVAGIVSTGLGSHGTCTWNGSSFVITSATTGTSSTVGFALPPTTGTDITNLLKLSSSTALPLTPGYAAELPVAFASSMAQLSPAWFGLTFASSATITNQQHLDVCTLIEAQDLKRIYGVTITDTSVLSSQVTNDLASQMMAAGYKQSCNQYSQNPYAIASLFGRAFSVNFAANRSTIILMYKQEPSIVAENLTSTQADTLEAKRCNVFTSYVNGTTIIQYGMMSGPAYLDEIHGLDWLQDQIQTACFNLNYTSLTKIPQTDSGMNQFVNACNQACDAGINNGLIAPGIWTGPSFGQLQTGQFLKDGFYVYAEPMANQSASDRAARQGTAITIAVKLAGGIQEIDAIINVNR